ncbi:hypothetical protein [Deinococcus seoulensis]|nr:hypothetical protein [Deinococcus seoulensis]
MKVSPRMVLIMVVLAMTPVLLMSVYGAVVTHQLYVQSAHFMPVPARVVERQDFKYLDETENRMKRVCIFRYAYSIEDKSYKSHRVTIGEDQTSDGARSGLCRWISDLPDKGKDVIALADLESPEVSIIIRNFPYPAIINAFLMGIVWLSAAILCFKVK